MPHTLWRGAVSFGLVTIPVRVYAATETKDITFRQVHPADGGRIRYKRICEVCGKEIPYAEIGKGYLAEDGRMAVLTDDDFAGLPSAEGKTVDVVQFVEVDHIDPLYFDRSYVLEADGTGAKPYALLRQALADSGKAAVVRVALRVRPDDRLSDVLPRMRRARRHVAVVADRDDRGVERVVGLVTLEDVLEAIVGDIRDEWDRPGT